MKFGALAQWDRATLQQCNEGQGSNPRCPANQRVAQWKSAEFLTRPMNFGVQHMHGVVGPIPTSLTNQQVAQLE